MSTTNGAANEPVGGRVIRTWVPPPLGVRQADGTAQEIDILFQNLPKPIAAHLRRHFADRLPELCELYLQLGHVPEAIFADPCTGATVREDISNAPCTDADIGMFSAFFGADEESITWDNWNVAPYFAHYAPFESA